MSYLQTIYKESEVYVTKKKYKKNSNVLHFITSSARVTSLNNENIVFPVRKPSLCLLRFKKKKKKKNEHQQKQNFANAEKYLNCEFYEMEPLLKNQPLPTPDKELQLDIALTPSFNNI